MKVFVTKNQMVAYCFATEGEAKEKASKMVGANVICLNTEEIEAEVVVGYNWRETATCSGIMLHDTNWRVQDVPELVKELPADFMQEVRAAVKAAAEKAATAEAAQRAAEEEAHRQKYENFSGVRAGLIYKNGVVVGEVADDDEEEEVLINLTPHPINLLGKGKEITLPKAENPARVEEVQTQQRTFAGVACVNLAYGEVVGLPELKEGTIYIVSRPVAEACKGKRNDVAVVTDFIRDAEGKIIAASKIGVLC